jgi:hypothetical protein
MVDYDSTDRHSPDKVYFRDIRNKTVSIPGLRVTTDENAEYQGKIPLAEIDAVSVLIVVSKWLSSQPKVQFREGWIDNG